MKNKDYKWTYNEILERFEDIEKKLFLDEAVIQGVPWWDTFRNQLFDELLVELGVMEFIDLREKVKKNPQKGIFPTAGRGGYFFLCLCGHGRIYNSLIKS